MTTRSLSHDVVFNYDLAPSKPAFASSIFRRTNRSSDSLTDLTFKPVRSIAKLILALAPLLTIGSTRSVYGELIMTVENAIAAPGGTGTFDVDLATTGDTAQVAGFSSEILVSAPGIEFTAVDTGTIAPYIFGTLQFAPLSASTFPGTDIVGSDVYFAGPFVSVDSTPVGLMHVSFSVSSGTQAGPVTVTLESTGSSVSDANGDALAFSMVNGTITVVPEPGAICLLAIGATAYLVARRTRCVVRPRRRFHAAR
jgi:hypothetical protein